ncbi:MAG: DUF1080 domain-containing protein [Rhodothermales bacterium]
MPLSARRLLPLLLLVPIALVSGCSTAQSEWRTLLTEDLAGWYTYLGYKLPADYDGDVPTDENGDPLVPVGYDRNVNDVFTMIQEDGEPVLRISGEYYGSISTDEDFENYHLTLQVRWGDIKWDPRTNLMLDSGVLYHAVGESGIDYWRAWPLSQEFQVMEGHMGDYWSIGSAAIDIRSLPEEGAMSAMASHDRPFRSFSDGTDQGGFCLRTADYESPMGDWTTLELITFEDKALHLVNGEVVMVLRNSRFIEDGVAQPLTSGKIQLQSEAAEVFFKDIRIRNVDAIPAEYAHFFDA